jgi:small-conductance mechanosensitive channel
MPDLLTMLDWTFYGNPVRAWIAALVMFTVAYFALGLVKRIVVRQLRRFSSGTETYVDNAIAVALSRTRTWFLVIVSVWAAAFFVTVPEALGALIGRVVILVVLLQIAIWVNSAIIAWREEYGDRMLEEDAAAVTTMRALTFLARMILWSVVLLVVLDNLGFEITAMIAGLGVGGIAVALAVQNILGDLFASLSIVLDKPFVVGDFIIVGELLGTVEHVGLKTTRVRSLSGEQLVFSNSDLLNSRIRNFKRMQTRRIVFEFGVVYQTPLERLREIPGVVQEIIEAQEDTRFDRAHFKAYGDFALDFEVVYHVLSADFNVYMDIQQAINFAMYERFDEMGVSFAYPTQTLFLKRGAKPSSESRLAS